MSKMRKWKCHISGNDRNYNERKNKGIWMDKSMSRFSPIQYSRNFMRFMRNGKRKNQNENYDKGDSHMSKLRKSLVKMLDELGEASGCHRIPERSFFYKGHQFPVCARCIGVCIGQLSAIIYGILKEVPLSISAALLGVMGIDWGIQELGIKESTNVRRFTTGICGGFGLFSIYIYAIKKVINFIKKY